MDEADGLARAGVRELLVVSQDTSAYGVDLNIKLTSGRGGLSKRTWKPSPRPYRSSGSGSAFTTFTLTRTSTALFR